MDRGAWQATVHGVAERWTRLKQLTPSQQCGRDSCPAHLPPLQFGYSCSTSGQSCEDGQWGLLVRFKHPSHPTPHRTSKGPSMIMPHCPQGWPPLWCLFMTFSPFHLPSSFTFASWDLIWNYHLQPSSFPRICYMTTQAATLSSSIVLLKCVRLFCDPKDCSLPGSSVHGILQARITGVGCYFILQGIFPTQGSNPCLLHLLHCRLILYHCTTWEALSSIIILIL